MDQKYLKTKDGKYYTENDVRKALLIVYGIDIEMELTENDIKKYIDDGKLSNICYGYYNPTLEELIKAGNKPAAVRMYYNHENKKNGTRISLFDAKNHIDKLAMELVTT